MKYLLKSTVISLLVVILFFVGTVVADRCHLREDLIRLHVVAASDSETDQTVKLKVRDAVLAHLQRMPGGLTAREAQAWLSNQLPVLTQIADQVLADAGTAHRVSISLEKEAFPARQYDTFSLPSGVYESLRIRIGDAKGTNWWCVVFPSLCITAAGEDFQDTAAGAGFPESLTGALAREEKYQIRFYILDILGRIENFLFGMGF